MADTKVGGVTIDVKADFAQFSSAMVQASRDTATHVAGINTSLASINEGIEGIKRGAELLGVSLGLGAFVEFIKGSLEAAASMKDLAVQAGVTAEDFQVLQFAARENGAEAAQMTAGVEHLTRSIGAAAAGSKTAIDMFNALGVKLLDVHGNIRSTDEVVIEIAKHVAEAKTPAEQARIAFEAFGKSGQSLIPTLIEIGTHFDETKQKAHDMGQVFDTETIQASVDLKNSFEALQIQLETSAAHLIAGPLKTFFDWFKSNLADATRAVEQSSIRKQPGTGSWWDFLVPSVSYGGQWPPKEARTKDDLAFPSTSSSTTGFGQPAATGGAHIETDAEKQAKAIAKVVQQLQFENEQIGLSSEMQKINSALRQAGVEITDEAGKQIAAEVHAGAERNKQLADENKLDLEAKTLKDSLLTPQQKYNDLLREYDELLAHGKISQEEHNKGVENAAKAVEQASPAYQAAIAQQKELQSAVENAAGSLLNDLGRAFTDSGTAADRWKNFMQHAIQDVMSAFDSLIKKLVGSGVSSLLGDLGGTTLGSLFGGGSAVLGPLAGSPMLTLASGGHMGVGDWAVVGEAGPELLYADTPGNVMSAARTRGVFGGDGGGGGNTAYIDARGADIGAVARLEAALAAMNYTFEHRAISAVSNERKRGGVFAATFGR